MTCRTCGTDIADKALICYRCGTATTEAKFKPAPVAGRRRRPLVVVAAIVLALLVLLAFFLLHSRGLTSEAWPDRFPALAADRGSEASGAQAGLAGWQRQAYNEDPAHR